VPSDVEVILGSSRFDPLEAQTGALDEENDAGFDRDKLRTWIVQFNHPLATSEADGLRARFGLQLDEFVPAHAFVERLSASTVFALREEPQVRAVAAFTPKMKVSRETRDEAAENAKNDAPAVGTYNAVLFGGVDASQVVEQLEGLGAQMLAVLKPFRADAYRTVRFALPFARLEDAAVLESVRWIEPVPVIRDDEATAATTLHPGTAGTVASLWAVGLHGEGEVVGVIDNGLADVEHCFFRDESDIPPGVQHRKVQAVRDARSQGPGRHATFVAGLVAGDDVRRPGEAPNRGGAWAARLVLGNRKDLEVFQPAGAPPTARTLMQELVASAAQGAVIHSNSWHAKTNGVRRPAVYDLLARDVDEFTWLHESHLVFGASGNNDEEQGSPGTAKNAVCVSAASLDETGPLLADGNPGPTADGRRKPDVLALGCGVRSAVFGTECGSGPDQPCASSYATPLAAAMAALVRQYLREGRQASGSADAALATTPSGALLKAILINSAVPPIMESGYPSNATGWGLPMVEKAIPLPGSPRPLLLRDVRHSEGLLTGEANDLHVVVDSSLQPLRVALAWSDAPGTLGAGNVLVNTLKLTAISPGGQAFIGNVFEGGESRTGGDPDAVNNSQRVVIKRPDPGIWRILVQATAVNHGRPGQGFGLVICGIVRESSA
jgi:hypothetical protein